MNEQIEWNTGPIPNKEKLELLVIFMGVVVQGYTRNRWSQNRETLEIYRDFELELYGQLTSPNCFRVKINDNRITGWCYMPKPAKDIRGTK